MTRFSQAHQSTASTKLLPSASKKEKMINIDLDEEAKMAFLFPDEAFIASQELSFEIAELAKAKKTGKKYSLDKSKENYTKELHNLADSVSLSFKYSAERLLSEALVDVIYLYDDSGMQSFRASPCGSSKKINSVVANNS